MFPKRLSTCTRPTRQAALALLAVGLAGCWRGCTCFEGEKTYEHLDGPVKVELVRSTKWVGGRIPGPVSDFVVRVHTTPPFDEPVACVRVELAEDKVGKHVAFRCEDTTRWTVLRLRDRDVHLRECDAPVGEGRHPDFTKLGSLSSSVARILDCASGTLAAASPEGDRRRATTWIQAVLADEGPDAAVEATGALAGMRSKQDRFARGTPWFDDAYAVLDDALRRRVLDAGCKALDDPEALPGAYVAMARRCSLDAPIGPTARTRLARAYAAAPPTAGVETDALRWAALLAPNTAGTEACAFLAREASDKLLTAVAATVIARHRTRCPTPIATGLDCESAALCGGKLCTETEANALLASAVDEARRFAPETGLRSSEDASLYEGRVSLVAAYAQGALASDLVRRIHRLGYAVAAEGPNCGDPMEVGSPCTCPSHFLDVPTLCRLPLDGGVEHSGFCDLRADDKRRRVVVTRACAGYLESCDVTSCCADLECAPEKGYRACAKPSSDR